MINLNKHFGIKKDKHAKNKKINKKDCLTCPHCNYKHHTNEGYSERTRNISKKNCVKCGKTYTYDM